MSDLVFFFGVIIMVHIVLLVHELGHLLIGLLQGFRFEFFIVGLLGMRREGDNVKVYFNKSLSAYGGMAATSPRNDAHNNAKKFARIILAGPLASILFAIVCLVTGYFMQNKVGDIFTAGGATSFMIFLATTVPSTTGGFFTDRKRYQRLTKPGKDQQVELAMLSIMGKFSKDDSYRNIERKEIECLISDETPFVHFYGLFNMMCWQLEHKGEIENQLKERYETASKEMSNGMVKMFNKEVEKYQEKLNS